MHKKRREDIYEIISLNIKKYRKIKGLTQLELARKTKYTPEYIRRIEAPKSKKYFSIDTICNISDALEVSISKFFEKN